MELYKCHEINIENKIPIRFVGKTQMFGFELLSIGNGHDDYRSRKEFIYRYKDIKKSFYFSQTINSKLCLSTIVNKKLFPTLSSPLIINILSSYSSYTEEGFKTPIVTFEPVDGEELEIRKVKLNLDILMFVDENIIFADLINEFINKFDDNIIYYSKSFAYYYDRVHSRDIFKLYQLYYVIENQLISLIFPENDLDQDTIGNLAKKLGIDDVRLLSRAQALYPCKYVLQQLTSNGTKLICPHNSINSSIVAGLSDVQVVSGRYTYHHYKQDGYNDKNWGCAYRSMQTIISWYLWQGYRYLDNKIIKSNQVPSLTDIQKILVEIKDKPASIIGSSAWIGSIEINLVLRYLFGVDSKIISLNNTSEISQQFQVLKQHFSDGGAPVMIGGADLAHTILGVALNKSNLTRMQALILDPHYPESNQSDLNVILTKGWCGWKDMDTFWKKNHSFNLCLPQKI